MAAVKGPPQVTAEWFKTKYIDEGMSCPQIALLIDRNPKTVWKLIRAAGIQLRPRGNDGSKTSEAHRAGMRRGWINRRLKMKPHIVACAECGHEFKRRHQYHGWQKFCSRKCSASSMVGRQRKAPELVRLSVFMRNCIHRIGVKTHGLDALRRHSESILGYSREALRAHLEEQFKHGMSWANYGGISHGRLNTWVIDHRRPIADCLSKGIKDPRVINALSNLQPLWSDENMRKHARVA